MLRLLEMQELSVGEVASVFQLPQSTVSRHLSTLGKAGWLVKRQFGTATYHSLTLDDLDDEARAVWIVVRAQIERSDETDEDDRRLAGVLADAAAHFHCAPAPRAVPAMQGQRTSASTSCCRTSRHPTPM